MLHVTGLPRKMGITKIVGRTKKQKFSNTIALAQKRKCSSVEGKGKSDPKQCQRRNGELVLLTTVRGNMALSLFFSRFGEVKKREEKKRDITTAKTKKKHMCPPHTPLTTNLRETSQ
jgi:hypothetical protein